MDYGWIFGAGALALSVVSTVRLWLRDRRSDGVRDGEQIARIDERLRRAERDLEHCVRADLLQQHLAALEARARLQARERPRED